MACLHHDGKLTLEFQGLLERERDREREQRAERRCKARLSLGRPNSSKGLFPGHHNHHGKRNQRRLDLLVPGEGKGYPRHVCAGP